MDNHLMKDEPKGTFFQPANPWLTIDRETKPYIIEQLNNIRPSRHQYIATSIIQYCLIMLKYNLVLTDRYSDIVLLIKQISRQHKKFEHVWNPITEHPAIVTTQCPEKKENFHINLLFLLGSSESNDGKETRKTMPFFYKTKIFKSH